MTTGSDETHRINELEVDNITITDEVVYTISGEVYERVAIDFPPEDESFRSLKAQAGADTNYEFVRTAWCWYEILLNQLEKGSRIVIVKDGVVREVDIRF